MRLVCNIDAQRDRKRIEQLEHIQSVLDTLPLSFCRTQGYGRKNTNQSNKKEHTHPS